MSGFTGRFLTFIAQASLDSTAFFSLKNKEMNQTKLAKILMKRGLNQTDLYDIIEDSPHKNIGKDRIHKIVTGKTTNYHLDTLRTLCHVLSVTPNDIIDFEINENATTGQL